MYVFIFKVFLVRFLLLYVFIFNVFLVRFLVVCFLFLMFFSSFSCCMFLFLMFSNLVSSSIFCCAKSFFSSSKLFVQLRIPLIFSYWDSCTLLVIIINNSSFLFKSSPNLNLITHFRCQMQIDLVIVTYFFNCCE